MTTEPTQRDLLEIYKLHAELADRVSQRREGANRLYIGLLVGLLVFVVALLRFGTGDGPGRIVVFGIGTVGALLSCSWYFVIRSHRQLNTGKFEVLQDLEKQLAYAFFTREWDRLSKGRDRRRYWRLTEVETSLPWIFLAMFIGSVVLSWLQ